MSDGPIEAIGQLARSAAVEAAWSQWSALTPMAASGAAGAAWTIVDPEALVLASLALSSVERRLEDLVAAWAREAGFLMSKSRFKSLSPLFSPGSEAGTGTRVGDFALYALEGGDSRWKSWASSSEPDPPPRTKSLGPLRLQTGPALILRLRAGFGVNAKADLLGMLLGLGGESAGLRDVAAATAYTDRMIRTATDEMILAGFISEIEGRPSSFYADPERWTPVLDARWHPDPTGAGPIPPWRYWSAVFAFLCDVSRWAMNATKDGWSEYVASSRARDLYETHQARLQRAGVRSSPPAAGPGARYLVDFHRLLEGVRSWTRETD